VPRPVIPFYAETVESVRLHYATFWSSLRRDGDKVVVRELADSIDLEIPAAAL